MKRFPLIFVLLLLLCVAMILAISLAVPLWGGDRNPAEPENAPRYSIQVVLKARNNPPDFWRIVEQGIDMAGQEFNVHYEVNGPSNEDKVDEQIEMLRAAAAKQPDAIILAATDVERLTPVCQELNAAGIPLVILDSDVNQVDRVTFVGTDNYELGRKLGMLVNEHLQPGDKFGVVAHVESASTAIERRRGLLDTVNGGEDNLADLKYCDGSLALSKQQTIEMLKAHPDIRCMVGLNESSALGICNALDELGLTQKLPLVNCDSSEAQIAFLENGTIATAVVQNPFNMGYISMQAAVQHLDGEKLPSVINTGSVVIDRDGIRKPENQKLLFPFTNVE